MKKDNLIHYKGYSSLPYYSAEDKLFYGKILGIEDLVDFCSENAKDIETEFHKAVDDYIDFCKEIGKNPEKEFTGMFNVRISPELHKRITAIAQTEGISLNKAVEKAIQSYV